MPADTAPGVAAAVDAAFREEWGRIVATLIAMTGDWDLAEECAQDAFARALQTWARDGVPTGPARGSPPPPATARSTCCAAGPTRPRSLSRRPGSSQRTRTAASAAPRPTRAGFPTTGCG